MKPILCGLLLFILTGCIAENYDVGHPVATIEQNDDLIDLPVANVDWNTESDTTKITIEDIEEFALEQLPITASVNEMLTLTFADSLAHEGEYTDVSIKASISNDDVQLVVDDTIENTMLTYDKLTVTMPDKPGNYLFEVNFTANNNHSQYVTMIIVQ